MKKGPYQPHKGGEPGLGKGDQEGHNYLLSQPLNKMGGNGKEGGGMSRRTGLSNNSKRENRRKNLGF